MLERSLTSKACPRAAAAAAAAGATAAACVARVRRAEQASLLADEARDRRSIRRVDTERSQHVWIHYKRVIRSSSGSGRGSSIRSSSGGSDTS